MRRAFRLLCSRADLDGKASKYYPRFRPRRLVMPIDPSDVHSSKRQKNQLHENGKAQRRLQGSVERRGAIRLAIVPRERSVGDAFRLALQMCGTDQIFDRITALTPTYLKPLEDAVKSAEEAHSRSCSAERLAEQPSAVPSTSIAHDGEASEGPHSSIFYALALDASRGISNVAAVTTRDQTAPPLSLREVDRMWDLLDRTPLNSPVHGVLAMRGKSLVETTVASLAYRAYPRLRSRHLQQLLHEVCGLLPCGRVAMRLGIAEIAGVEAEVGMWRELNVLTQRFNEARKKAAIHLQRVHEGTGPQRRWYWKAVLRSAAGRLKLFPVEAQDLQPRMEWLRNSVFAFVAFAEMAERSGDGEVRVVPLIEKLFCAQLARHVHAMSIVNRAEALLNAGKANGLLLDDVSGTKKTDSATTSDESNSASGDSKYVDLLKDVQTALTRVHQLTPDEQDVLDAKVHPLNLRSDNRHEQFASSGGAHATQALRDDIFEQQEAERHRAQAPSMLVHALRTQNAFKEAQIILKYAPNVSPALRGAPIDVEQVVRKVVEVHETNNYATLHNAQQYRQVEYTVCRLYCGKRCVGEGKGETLMEAMQEASQDMVLNYYLHCDSYEVSTTAAKAFTAAASPGTATNADADTVRIQAPHLEEEIFF